MEEIQRMERESSESPEWLVPPRISHSMIGMGQ